MRRPDFIIVGAMKCATSTLHEQLAAQSGVFMSDPKEPNFFSDDDVFARGKTWYESLFDAAPAGSICGESSTHYTKLPTHPHTIDRMKRCFGPANVRFIYVMRHPIDRLLSQHVHEWSQQLVPSDLERAIRIMPEMVDYSRYGMQIAPYIETFGPDRVLPVFFEHLKRDPTLVFRRVGTFLGLDATLTWDDSIGKQNVSSRRMRKSPLRDAIVNAPGVRHAREKLIPQTWRDRVKSLWTMRSRPKLSKATAERLTEELDRDFESLAPWLGFQISCSHYHEQIEQSRLTTSTNKEHAA